MSRGTFGSSSSVERVPNEGDRPIVTVRGSERPEGLERAIVRYFPDEGDGDEAVRARKREMMEAGAIVVRVMPKPPKSKVPAPKRASKASSARESVLGLAKERGLKGLEEAVTEVMAEVGL